MLSRTLIGRETTMELEEVDRLKDHVIGEKCQL